MERVQFPSVEKIVFSALIMAGLIVSPGLILAQSEEAYSEVEAALDPETQELLKAREAAKASKTSKSSSWNKAPKRKKKTFTKAEAFVAGPDWEFDGFVSGGQDSRIKSMYVINDLIYLNIGAYQGIEPGDSMSIYRRGDRVRDPQTGRFIGYEVRRAAIAEVTNKVDDETCAVRIRTTYEGVEVGDLVRKD